MQTFLPYPDFRMSAVVLDTKRLGKQRVEAAQLLRALDGVQMGWRNHPAAKMWAGHTGALRHYLAVMISVWVSRGFQNNMEIPEYPTAYSLPSWIGDASFHASHRSNLLRKDPEWYGQWGWEEPPTLPYVWPTP